MTRPVHLRQLRPTIVAVVGQGVPRLQLGLATPQHHQTLRAPGPAALVLGPFRRQQDLDVQRALLPVPHPHLAPSAARLLLQPPLYPLEVRPPRLARGPQGRQPPGHVADQRVGRHVHHVPQPPLLQRRPQLSAAAELVVADHPPPRQASPSNIQQVQGDPPRRLEVDGRGHVSEPAAFGVGGPIGG
jgi:hypothetical protein